MNGGTGKKEGINRRDIMKRDMEWTNWKETGRFRDSWDCFLLVNIVTIILIDRIFIIFFIEKNEHNTK